MNNTKTFKELLLELLLMICGGVIVKDWTTFLDIAFGMIIVTIGAVFTVSPKIDLFKD